MLAARRCLPALALALAACASSSGGIAVSVAELRMPGIAPAAVGDHYYRIRVTNRSAEPIVVESIHLEVAGMTEFDVEDATESFDESLGSEDTRTFDMQIRVLPGRDTSRKYIDSLRVMIMGRNEKGNFTDSGDYPVGVERGER
jgi:hypothetical protein